MKQKTSCTSVENNWKFSSLKAFLKTFKSFCRKIWKVSSPSKNSFSSHSARLNKTSHQLFPISLDRMFVSFPPSIRSPSIFNESEKYRPKFSPNYIFGEKLLVAYFNESERPAWKLSREFVGRAQNTSAINKFLKVSWEDKEEKKLAKNIFSSISRE